MELKITPTKYRILSSLVDGIINVLAVLLILIFTSSIDIIKIITKDSGIVDAMSIINLIAAGIIIEVYFIIYLVLIPLYNKGSTIGQRMFHMSIVKEDGSDVDFETLFIRQVVGNTLILFSTFAIGILVSFFTMLYRKDNCCLADIVGKTYVVDRV